MPPWPRTGPGRADPPHIGRPVAPVAADARRLQKGPEVVQVAGAGLAGGGAVVVRPCVRACALGNRAFAVAQQVLEAG